jgi:hypothetical protein
LTGFSRDASHFAFSPDMMPSARSANRARRPPACLRVGPRLLHEEELLAPQGLARGAVAQPVLVKLPDLENALDDAHRGAEQRGHGLEGDRVDEHRDDRNGRGDGHLRDLEAEVGGVVPSCVPVVPLGIRRDGGRNDDVSHRPV